ncbi:glycosyltransferase family 90 protein, partial [Tortispora caseinolytica NRRL Y-17796]
KKYTLKEYVEKYHKDHKRAPPPGFDKWFEFAIEQGVVDFDHYDAIYEDLRPFWSINPADIRADINGLRDSPAISILTISEGNASANFAGYRISDVVEMFRNVAHLLPDMEIAINLRDQPRVLASFEELQELEQKYNSSISNEIIHVTSSDYSQSLIASHYSEKREILHQDFSGQPLFRHAFNACAPDSAVMQWKESGVNLNEIYEKYHYRGLVSNYSYSGDLCSVAPLIHDKHGFLSISPTLQKFRRLVPVFSESKTSINNDIRYPGNKYIVNAGMYGYDERHDVPWHQKKDVMMWRGITTGGVEMPDTYMKIHRNRLVDTFNGSYPGQPIGTIYCETFGFGGKPHYEDCVADTSQYLEEHADVGFYALEWCNPDPDCKFLHDLYKTLPMVPSTDQYTNKYLVDVDGHSFSARFKPFLESNSLPFKATIFREWHDSRIIPWLHFIPMDNQLDDGQKLMTYFTGMEGVIYPHQGIAERIALNGKDHANLVLKNGDINAYLVLLLLEYARLLDDNRDNIGF